MIWIICGLISFTIQMYILKHTHVDSDKGLSEFRWEKAEKLKVPIWIVLLMFLSSMFPFINIAEIAIFLLLYLLHYENFEAVYSWKTYTYWRFKDKFLSREI